MSGMIAIIDTELRDWCRERLWFVRLPLVVWFAWIGIQHVRDPLYNSLF